MSAAAFFDSARALKRELTGESGIGLTQEEVTALNKIIVGWAPAEIAKSPAALTEAGAFFKAVRGSFGVLLQPQVDGFQTLLQAFGAARWPLSWAAYGLATSWHETAAKMEPVKEAFWLGDDWRRHNLKYYPWYGRGYVQLTWEANYKRADEDLKLGGALIANPDVALKPDISARIIVWGMETGAFTGKKLVDYLPLSGRAGFDAYKEARRIINGTDKWETIAKEAQSFEAALLAGGWA